MRNTGRKLLLSSLILIAGISSANAGFVADAQEATLKVGVLRGSIGMESWAEAPSPMENRTNPLALLSGHVFLPDIAQIAELANANPVLDDEGNPLDMVTTAGIGDNSKKEVVWERFNRRGKHLRDKFAK